MIIDTHVHLDDKSYVEDLDTVLFCAKKDEVDMAIIPGADIGDLPRAEEISSKYEDVYMSAGIHPYHHEQYDEKVLLEYLKNPKCVAVGECGLDYFRLPEGREDVEKGAQKEVFISQIKLAQQVNKPLIVHIRDASSDSFEILRQYDAKKSGGVLHCFNADEVLLDLVDDGFYFGIGGVLTFKNAQKLVDIVPRIPLERIVIETDGPYLTPHPYRGTRNEPKYTKLVVEKLSEILQIPYDELCDITTNNAKRLFFDNP